MQYTYNVGAQYEIIGRIQDGVKVTHYVVKDKTDDTIKKIEKAIVEQLALNKQIYNCQAQVYGDLVNLKGIKCKISKLQKYDTELQPIKDEEKPQKKKVVKDLRIIGKVQNGRYISDYVITSTCDTNKIVKVPKDMILQLAKDGRIINAKVQYNNGTLILRGTEKESLNSIAQYR